MVQIVKQSLEQIQRYRATQFWTKNQDQIYTFDPNEHFLENFIIHGIVFCLLFFNVM